MSDLKMTTAASILVVDDTPDNLSLLTRLLTKQGYRVRGAREGGMAIEAARDDPPDLILLDILMPGLDGYQVCERLKADERTHEIPVIFISALSESFDKVRGFSVGGIDYITKPFELSETMARIEMQLRVGRLQRQIAKQNRQLQQEISDRLRAEAALVERANTLRDRNEILTQLAKNPALKRGDLKTAVQAIVQASIENLKSERASVWLFDETRRQLQCIELFPRHSRSHDRAGERKVEDYPRYFQELERGVAIAVGDARQDPRTRELETGALTPTQIPARLDMPIYLGGETVGVFCVEQWGETPQEWTEADLNFVRSLSELVSLGIEARERERAERALENELHRSKLLRQITEQIRAQFDPQQIFETAATQIGRAFQVNRCSIHTYCDRPQPKLSLVAHYAEKGYELFHKLEVPIEGNPHLEVMLGEDRAICAEEGGEREQAGYCWEAQSLLSVRTSYNGQPNGAIGLHQCDRLRQWSAEERELLEAIAAQLGIAIAGAQLLDREKQACAERDRQNRQLQREINERRLTQKALEQSEQKHRALVETSQDLIWSMDIRGRYTFVNPAVEQIYGYSPAETLGKKYTQFVSAKRLKQDRKALRNLLGGTPWVKYETTHIAKDGSEIHLIFNAIPLRNSEGRVIGTTGTATDISDRLRSEIEILRSKDLLESIFNESADAIFLVNPESNKIADCNRRAVELFEAQGKENLIGLEEHSLQKQPFSAEKIAQISTEVSREGCWSSELEYITKSGKTFWGNLAIKPIRVAGQEMTLVRVTDITDRKQTEEALFSIVEGTAATTGNEFFSSCVRYLARVLQVRYAAIAELIDETTCRFRTLALWTGETWGENIEYHLKKTSEEDLTSRETPTALHCAEAFLLHDGASDHLRVESFVGIPLLNSEGKYIGHLAVFDMDVRENNSGRESILTIFAARAAAELERQKAQIALEESAERERAIAKALRRMRQTLDLEQIFSATTSELRQVLNCDRVAVYQFNADWSGTFVCESLGSEWKPLVIKYPENGSTIRYTINDENCTIIEWKSASESLEDTYLKQTQGGAYGRGANCLVVEDIYAAEFEPCYLELLESFQAKAYITVPIFCGKKLWGLLAAYENKSPRQWKEAEVNIVVQIGIQLGVALQQAQLLQQTKQQSNALQQAAYAADAANRAKSEFLAAMSHELRTPLNAILGFTQLMNRDINLSPDQQEKLRIINRSGEHLLGLINDILEMSKIEAGRTTFNQTSFDLLALLETLEEMLHLKANAKGLRLIFQRGTNLPQYVKTDEGKLRQVLINLLGNAIKFTEKGSVSLRVRVGEGETNPSGLQEQFSERLYFEIEDTGPGISPEERDRLFEPFAQTEIGEKSNQGTGLGLPISQKFVEFMGGEITLSSTPGKGSIFSFHIAIAKADASQVEHKKPRRKAIGIVSDRTYRILVVDDAYESRLLLSTLFQSIGFQVREAENGREAVELWHSWQPQVICMDMQMPVMDGYEATQAIKRSPGGEKSLIIALTASAFEEDRKQVLSVGCDEFVPKPFREELLLEKIADCLKIAYVYESDNCQAQKETSDELSISPDRLREYVSQMPPHWVAQVHRASCLGSDDLILQSLEQIPPELDPLATALTQLADNFQFEIIMELTQPEEG
ncbi:GAF domain-containing protein [Phormidium sp. CCY1219]|uniref:GAF domain-containing protein n=1 Tax=Phormidium sp. CCY1219 TaxID=2886104 RepID=UPI002D1EE188|nr:GAF domain-containing protein [Phormidium sp. CCY1219]MEB3831832.1 response regulator [Phormidium sp. CCY1219]